jgi:hypothetical protein
MQHFELAVPPSPAWTDLTRDLVAAGVSSLDLDMDRFSDLLVLTDLVTSEMIDRRGATRVEVNLSVADGGLKMTFEAIGAAEGPAPISDLALSALAEEHWHSVTESGVLTGFTLSG